MEAQTVVEQSLKRHVACGKSKWFTIEFTDGASETVSGLYEVSFLKWLVECGFTFVCHPSPLVWYDADGKSHKYEPDFWISELQTYVDVKAAHFARLHHVKLAAVCAQHSNVVILTEEDFAYLKIPILLDAEKISKGQREMSENDIVSASGYVMHRVESVEVTELATEEPLQLVRRAPNGYIRLGMKPGSRKKK